MNKINDEMLNKHYEAIRAAQAAVDEAQRILDDTKRVAAEELSPYSVGDKIEGKVSSSGDSCSFKIDDIDVQITGTHKNRPAIYFHGRKLKKDGTPMSVAAYYTLYL